MNKFLPQFIPSYWVEDYDIISMSFTKEISIGFVSREEFGYSFLLLDEFNNLNINLDKLFELSIYNLELQIEDCDIKEYKIEGGKMCFWYSENDNFTAVRVLLKKYRNILNEIFHSEFFFSIPHRDLITCWFTTDKVENNKFIEEINEDYNESDYKLSNAVYQFKDIELFNHI